MAHHLVSPALDANIIVSSQHTQGRMYHFMISRAFVCMQLAQVLYIPCAVVPFKCFLHERFFRSVLDSLLQTLKLHILYIII